VTGVRVVVPEPETHDDMITHGALGETRSSTGARAATRPLTRGATMGAMSASPRFLTLADVAEVLNTSSAQVYALVRRGELAAIKIGGRGQWRVESAQLEEFIQRMYSETRTFVDEHPFVDADPES
jgi:excisionase family DNA binding protein